MCHVVLCFQSPLASEDLFRKHGSVIRVEMPTDVNGESRGKVQHCYIELHRVRSSYIEFHRVPIYITTQSCVFKLRDQDGHGAEVSHRVL